MRNKFYIIFLILSLNIFPQVEPEIDVLIDKRNYFYGEIIHIAITYKNNSNEVIDRSQQPEMVFFELINEKGDSLPGTFSFRKFFGARFTLLPGEEKSIITNVNQHFGRPNYGIVIDFIAPGKYNLIANVDYNGKIIEIKKYEIEVFYPEGDDLSVFNVWAFDSKHLRNNFQNVEKSKKYSKVLVDLLKKFPDSNYALYIADHLSTEYRYHQEDSEKEKDIEEFVINKYLTKMYPGWLNVYISKKITKTDKITYIDKLLTENFPPTIKKYLMQARKDIIEEQ